MLLFSRFRLCWVSLYGLDWLVRDVAQDTSEFEASMSPDGRRSGTQTAANFLPAGRSSGIHIDASFLTTG